MGAMLADTPPSQPCPHFHGGRRRKRRALRDYAHKIHNGKVNEEIMREELLTRHELAASLRAAGCEEIDHVRVATLENNGQITFSLRTRPDT